MKPSLLKKEEVYAYDVNEGCRASIRTGQECVNEKMGKKRSSEMDAKSVNTDPEMLAECCNPSEETSEKLIALSRQVSEDDDSELSAPTAVATCKPQLGHSGRAVCHATTCACDPDSIGND